MVVKSNFKTPFDPGSIPRRETFAFSIEFYVCTYAIALSLEFIWALHFLNFPLCVSVQAPWTQCTQATTCNNSSVHELRTQQKQPFISPNSVKNVQISEHRVTGLLPSPPVYYRVTDVIPELKADLIWYVGPAIGPVPGPTGWTGRAGPSLITLVGTPKIISHF